MALFRWTTPMAPMAHCPHGAAVGAVDGILITLAVPLKMGGVEGGRSNPGAAPHLRLRA